MSTKILLQHQSNTSQSPLSIHTVRWMPTTTTQESSVAQSGRQHQGNSPRASQPHHQSILLDECPPLPLRRVMSLNLEGNIKATV
ncbi:hypothetical protein V6N11_049309 [Hibiscus sabdariffa]|uniref:Uncharacterized protein n=2 Tax=Hibiscus sabdariffa TaxID=183260 RepID=A0ABR2BN68_9ROSI